MTEEQRWMRVLEAHRDEHEAMRERGLSRMNIFGRPRGMGATVQMPEPFSPYSLHQVNLSPYQGMGALTAQQKTQWVVSGLAIVAVGSLAWWFLR